MGDKTIAGPFRTKQPVQMVDFEMQENDLVEFEIDETMDTALLYVYEGGLSGAGDRRSNLDCGTIILLDAYEANKRRISMATSSGQTAGVMLFAGKKIREPIAWRGPIVMNTQEQISRRSWRYNRDNSHQNVSSGTSRITARGQEAGCRQSHQHPVMMVQVPKKKK